MDGPCLNLLLLSASPPTFSPPGLTWTVKREPDTARKDGGATWTSRGAEPALPDIGTERLQADKKFQITVLRCLPWVSIIKLTSD